MEDIREMYDVSGGHRKRTEGDREAAGRQGYEVPVLAPKVTPVLGEGQLRLTH